MTDTIEARLREQVERTFGINSRELLREAADLIAAQRRTIEGLEEWKADMESCLDMLPSAKLYSESLQDARRYRWLREGNTSPSLNQRACEIAEGAGGQYWDDAIDAAIAASTPGAPETSHAAIAPQRCDR